ncbi:M23 family metallopeptidase [Demequina sp. NBRC 110054]|uniref:M23 family metallopeptidase n=1 Tax=Demequina sp. NBRC 110054 TaxID=1570343 RepID=UPI000A04F75E|nr:M23 family metallopeptidase [Demequina sp. NBRC 110054]
MSSGRNLATQALSIALVLAVAVGLSGAGATPSSASSESDPAPLLRPPLVPTDVVRGADIPAERWLPGHRGVDLATAVGADVLSPASGEVTFAGAVAGRGVVVIAVGTSGLRTTLEPVDATVVVGEAVTAGAQVGSVQEVALVPGVGHCAPEACLHWGLKRGDDYLDPLDWTEGWGPIRLKAVAPD